MCNIMFTMRTATIRQIRNDLQQVLGWVAGGEEVVIVNRKKPVARLSPVICSEDVPVQMPDFGGRMVQRFGKRKTTVVRALLEEREQRW